MSVLATTRVTPGRFAKRVSNKTGDENPLHRRPNDTRFSDVSTQNQKGNHFVKTLRRSQHVGGGSTRPVQFHEDLSWEEKKHPQTTAQYHIHSEMCIELSQIFTDRKAKSLNVKREIVAKTEEGILNVPNTKYAQNGKRR